MKLLITLTIALFISAINFAQQVINVEQKFHDHNGESTLSFGSRSETPTAPFIDITHVNLRIEAEPGSQVIYGDVRLTYKLSQEIDTLWLDFDSALTMSVNLVQVDFTQNSKYYRKGNFLVIPIGSKQAIHQTHNVRIVYRGVPNGPDIGSYFRSDNRHVWTRSEPYGARYWWPCIMTLQDKIDSADIYLVHPKEYLGVSNGLLQSVDSSRSNAVTHWKHTYPVAFYLIAWSIGDYAHITKKAKWKSGAINVENYVFKDQVFWVDSTHSELEKTFGLFDSLFGEYPFINEHYGHVQTSMGGGMEHQTMSHMRDLNQPLVAHELAHQWFGNKITCGSWEDLWLNESFATYLTALTYEAGFGDEKWADWKENTNRFITNTNSGSVFPIDTMNFNVLFSWRLTYNKGAYVLHTLRDQIGDKAFFKGVNNFINDPALSYGFAITDQFRAHMEAASNRDLNEFFNDWYMGEGHPNYILQYNLVGSKLYMEVTQGGSSGRSPFFEMDLTVAVYLNGLRFDFKLPITQQNEVFVETFGRVPDSVQIDPDYNTLIGLRDVREGIHVLSNASRPDLVSSAYRVFPNPVKSELNVRPILKSEEFINYEIRSINNALLSKGALESQGGSVETVELPVGIYFIQLKSKDSTTIYRFVKD